MQGGLRDGGEGSLEKNRQDGGSEDHQKVTVSGCRQKMNEEEEILLEREVHIMKNIQHPNIVEFYDYFSDSKHIYLVLEFLSGGELYD
jgi:serine/threonine protein kinase